MARPTKNALVFGYGRSGQAAEASLGRLGFAVSVLNGEMPFPAGAFEVAVVSPGVALTHPWIAAARARGIPIKSELQLGCEELKRLGWKLLAVTGSKGKSSVVKLCASALGGVPCGNYGRPVCDLVTDSPGWAVVEVSSFQLETTMLSPDTFEAAAILNLQEDHLDRHGSREIYHGLKRKLLAFTRHPIAPFVAETPEVRLLAGSYFDNEVLRLNGLSAIALLRGTGLADWQIAAAFAAFRPLSHRFACVATIDGVRYVDDSKATSLAALAAGVRMARGGVRLIAGGLPKGDDPKSILPTLTERVKKVYLIGQCAEVFSVAWYSCVDCEVCCTLERAVASARRDAAKGETVLLSPGTASFDQFKSFEERGESFVRLVQKGRKE